MPLCVSALAFSLPVTGLAATYTVCNFGCDYLSPEAAVNDPLVIAGDTIDITNDTYVLTATLQVDQSLTILANGSTFDANGIRAIDVTGVGTNFSLTNITIRNGQAGAGLGGGAMRVAAGSTATVINGDFENNRAEKGGAIHNEGGNIMIRESRLNLNQATSGIGGAVLTSNGGLSNIIRTEVDGNAASLAAGGLAVEGAGSQLEVIESTVSDNIALSAVQTTSSLARSGTTNSCGGGPMGQTFIASASSLSGFTFDVRLNGNVNPIPNDLVIPGQVRQGGPTGPVIGTASAFVQGGAWPGGSTQTLNFSLDTAVATIAGNTYSIESPISGPYSMYISPGDAYPDGARYNCGATLITSADFTFRTFGGEPGAGSGIHASAQATANILNSTVSGNVGDGATASNAGTINLNFSTVTNNSRNGLSTDPTNPSGITTFGGSIIAGNAVFDCDGAATSNGYNLIGDDSGCVYTPALGDIAGTNASPLDPLLGPLQFNGGRTFTHAIDESSPAFDAGGTGLPGQPCESLTRDQRGSERPRGDECDIGSFEILVFGPLQTLINNASPGDTIVVPDGTYTESISLGDDKTLSGSGPANVIIDVTNLNTSAITATGSFSLEGIRVTGGDSNTNGGGIIANGSGWDITLNNVLFDNNRSNNHGGAIYLADGNNANISQSTFRENRADDSGGAIRLGGDLDSQNNVFDDNSASLGGAISLTGIGNSLRSDSDTYTNNVATIAGGAIYESDAVIDVTLGVFQFNRAGEAFNGNAGRGGAVFTDSSADISLSMFTQNSVDNNFVEGGSEAGMGGAIFNMGVLELTSSTISTSQAGAGAGLFNDAVGEANISDSTFENNTADGLSGTTSGGAIGGAGSIFVNNSTLTGNSTSDGAHGAGIAMVAGTARLNNVTLAYNASSGLGGAFFGEPGAQIIFSNSLLGNNTDNGINCDAFESRGYNLYQTLPCTIATTDIIAAPQIELLASNGGDTQTHALLAQSPAVDAGHPVPLFSEFNANNIGTLQVNGGARVDGNTLLLADEFNWVGSAFVSRPFNPNQDFSAQFDFQITPNLNFGQASDGITFTIADSPTVLGGSGGLLGIAVYSSPGPGGTGVMNGVSVEFDTWVNGQAEGANDPGSNDHVGININGNLSSLSTAVLGAHGTLSDGSTWTAWIDYDALSNTLEVRTSNDGIRPAGPTLSESVDIASLTGPNAYVGFTGASAGGAIAGRHRISSFSFENSCDPLDQRGMTRPQGVGCDIGAYEGVAVPLSIGAVTLRTATLDQGLADGSSYPGVVDIPIIDIPIEKLTGDRFNSPEAAPLGSFPIGSFPIGSFDLRASPMGSFPLGSFPIGSFPIGSFPLGSFPLSSLPLLEEGGWKQILNEIPQLRGAPLQNITLERVLSLNPLPPSVADIELRNLAIEGSPLASLSLPGLSLGDTSVAELDAWAANADPAAAGVCETLNGADASFADCSADDTLLGLEVKGAPVAALSLSTLPLGSFPIGSFPLGSFPIGSFPLGSFPLGSFPIGSFPIGSFPLGSFPLGSFPIGSFPMGSFDLLAAPTDSLPLGSFPIGSFPLGSFELDGKSFCQFYDENALASGDKTCAQLGINPSTNSLADLVAALQQEAKNNGDSSSGIASTPLGSFPMGSFPIGSFPIGSFPIGSFDLEQAPLSELTLAHFDGCQAIDGTDDCSATPALSGASTLKDVENTYGTLAASPIGSFPIGSFAIADLPMGSFPLGSFEINGTPLGSFPLGSFDLLSSPLGSFPLGSFPIGSFDAIIDDPDGRCSRCQTLAEAELAGVISSTATLSDLTGVSDFDNTTLGVVLDAMTLAMIHGAGTLADIKDPGDLTLGQMMVAMMLKSDFPWETIPLDQLDAQSFAAKNYVEYIVDIPLTGNGSDTFTITVTVDEEFMYKPGSSIIDIVNQLGAPANAELADPQITDNGDGTQTLVYSLVLSGNTDNSLAFSAVSPMSLGTFRASAFVRKGADAPVSADSISASVSVIPDPVNDVSQPGLATTAPLDVLSLGYINTPDDSDYYRIAPPAAGDRVAVFMSNPEGDNDLIMYEPLSTVEAKGQLATSAALDSIPFEDDGVDYQGNLSEEPNALEDVNLADAPLASISTNRGTQPESVSAIAGNTEPFTLQVSGYNGARSELPYTLRVKVTPQVPSPQCTARSWPGSQVASVEPAGSWMPDTNAVFLVNGSRLASSDPQGAEGADDALAAINSLINAPGITNGVVVDVSTIFGVNYGPWDANPCDVDAANAIVNAITAYLEEQRLVSPRLTYVTIVGSDEVIPFARKPDETAIANESTFAGEFSDNAMYGSLITRHFLSDDTYGDLDPIPWLDRYLNVPELGVGRLVELAADIETAAENYLASGGVLDPQTALSAGYDFVADASQDIDNTFNAYSPELGFSVESALIDPPGILPKSDAWSATDFLNAAAVNTANPVDLVSFNMHFDFDEALPSIGDATGDYESNLLTVSDFDGADLTGGIWFTVGCHSGTNVPDVSVVGGAPSEDWAQTFNRLGALYLAQNAYGLGDTEAIALTERLMANFARNLTGSLTIGQAHAFAKQQYFADLGLYGEYDFKALQAATLFGLPMYQYGLGASVEEPLPALLPVATDPLSGLTAASWSLPNTGITETTGTSKGDLFSVRGEVQFVHYRPLQPIVRQDVTGPNGEVASGAFLTSLSTEDKMVTNIAFARPVIDQGDNEPEIETDEVVFPTSFTNIASFKAPPPGGGPMEPRQQLNVIVGQFTSPPDGASSGTERLFRSFDAQVFYRQAAPAAAAPFALLAGASPANDFSRPEFDNVQASVVGSGGSQQASFSVDVTDNGTVLRVAVLYLQSVSGTPERGNWVLVDLVEGVGGNWTGGGPVDLSGIADGQIDYMVQAVDSNGNVANSTFKGLFYVAEQLPPPPDPGTPGNIGVVVKVDGDVVDPGGWITYEPVDIEVTDRNPAISYVYSVDFSPFRPLTAAGFQIEEDGVHTVTVHESDGSNPVTFVVLIDTTPPDVVITTPSNGEFIVQGQSPAADFDCLDAGSGISSCIGTVSNGSPVPSATTGLKTFSVSAQDDAELGPKVVVHDYYVVKPLELSGPAGPILLGEVVTITASATDLGEFVETVMVDWGDGSAAEEIDISATGVSAISASHTYSASGAFDITLSVDYEGRFQQSAVVEFLTIFNSNSHVSGKGHIQSPSGAYTPQDLDDEDITGDHDFDFDLKYKYKKTKVKGKKAKPVEGEWQIDGKSKFKFREGDLDIEATGYDWLVTNNGLAHFKGTAKGKKKHDETIYFFEVIAEDADDPASTIDEDRFGIRIWTGEAGEETVLYDSMLGGGSNATTPVDKGSVKVHLHKAK